MPGRTERTILGGHFRARIAPVLSTMRDRCSRFHRYSVGCACGRRPLSGNQPPANQREFANGAPRGSPDDGHAARAVRAGPDLAETQSSVGLVKFWFDWDWAAAEAALRGAIALDPRYPLAHRNLGIVLSHSGRHEEARLAARRARELDPLHAAHHALSS